MTIEEAAEIILGGKAYRSCPRCKGAPKKGLVAVTASWSCSYCKSNGAVRSARYAKACRLLGREEPPFLPPPDPWVFPGDIPDEDVHEISINGVHMGYFRKAEIPTVICLPQAPEKSEPNDH